jgi:excisionase family DNA binding protein
MNGEVTRLIDAEELAEVLRLPLASVWRLARDGSIPCYRAGRLMRFDLARVLEALEQREALGQ